ncbi:MAG: hypothetical protein F6K45_23080 [Kamptonema sp. SIO1D9]|nr:hypothetical protein [Kamptonema sp. SIO1D9]
MSFFESAFTPFIAATSAVAIAFSNSPKKESVTTPTINQTQSLEQVESNTLRRHQVNCKLTQMEDLKVSEKDRVNQGQLLCDRTRQRQNLEARKKQIEISIAQMSLPMKEPLELPPPDFSVQEAAIISARNNLELIQKAELPEFRFKSEDLNRIHDREIYTQRATILERQATAAIALESAIAQLEKAKADYQQKQYQHSLNLIQYQTSQQRQQYQLASLSAQLQQVENNLTELTSVQSPVTGRIRRIKFTGQNDQTINVEIYINVKENS